jgi:hypothetical protein
MKKKVISFVIAALMACSAVPAVAAAETETKTIATETKEIYAEKKAVIAYSKHLTDATSYDITGSSIAWVKQANGALIWVPATDSRSDDAIVTQAKSADPSLANGTSEFAVMKGIGTAKTPNSNGSQATVTVYEADGKLILSIDGKYSHFVKALANVEPVVPEETVAPEEPTAPAEPVVEGEKVSIRIDAPKKMAVAFPDGTVYYGGEMKEVVVGQEYPFQMCSVNWENGIYDGKDNGIAGTVVYRMEVVHQNDFNKIAEAAKEEPERYIVKGIDVIDTKEKKIIINCDAKDTHLETDVNTFFAAYRFHFEGQDYNKKTGIEKVVNTPLESLSVNLPVGSTITCDAYYGEEKVASNDVFITKNSGKGIYANEFYTSVNDYTWSVGAAPVLEEVKEKAEAVEEMKYAEAVQERVVEYAK